MAAQRRLRQIEDVPRVRGLIYTLILVAATILFFDPTSSNEGEISPSSLRSEYGFQSRLLDLASLPDPKAGDTVGDAGASLDGDAAAEKHTPKKLIHVFNPYNDISSHTTAFSPIGYEQWIMLASVRSAQQAYHDSIASDDNGQHLFDSVSIVCAVLEADVEVLGEEILSSYCDHTSILSRTARTEYGNHLKPMPFVQDIIDAGIAVGKRTSTNSGDDDFYLIFTNSDISLTGHFYSFVEANIKGKMALTVNRLTLSFGHLPLSKQLHDHDGDKDGDSATFLDQWQGGDGPVMPDGPFEAKDWAAKKVLKESLDVAEKGLGHVHPGHDCFIFHSSFLNMINFGDLFVGYPPWDTTAHVILGIMADEYKSIRSNKLGTFHVGNNKSWMKRDSTITMVQSFSGREEDLENLLWCPFSRHFPTFLPQNLHELQLAVNIGKMFRPKDEGSPVPAFVEPGYEQVFLDNYQHRGVWGPMYWSDEGYPMDRGKFLEKKLRWIEKISGVTPKVSA